MISQGDRTYIGGGGGPDKSQTHAFAEHYRHSVSRGRPGWANRSHPLVPGVNHSYTLRISLGSSPSYPAAVATAWRKAWDEADPIAKLGTKPDLAAVCVGPRPRPPPSL